jgi:hypothetical protein
MKPTRDTAYLTIATSIVSALALLLTYSTQNLTLNFPPAFRYLSSFIHVICFTWLMIFVVSILKYANEKPFIINTFIIYLIYSLLLGLTNIAVGLFNIPVEKILIFYTANGFVNLLAVIWLVVIVFLLRPTEFRLPLRIFAFSELFILLFYTAIPPLLVLSGNSDYRIYIRYLGLVYLIIPAVGLYIAVTALNVINKQLWQKPFSETENPDWPPYEKPNL